MPNAPLSVIDNKKCPFLTPSLMCISTGKATIECFDHKFHSKCNHRTQEEARWKGASRRCHVNCGEDRVH